MNSFKFCARDFLKLGELQNTYTMSQAKRRQVKHSFHDRFIIHAICKPKAQRLMKINDPIFPLPKTP